MIVVDTSALLAVTLDEPEAEEVERALERAPIRLMSAATFAEALIVARRRGVGAELVEIVERLEIEVLAFSAKDAFEAADAYDRFGRGVHPANLNLGDCFAYALARALDVPLAFVGNDFAQTDLRRA